MSTPTVQVPYLNISDPSFAMQSEELRAAREQSWYARTNYGIAVLRYDEVSKLLKSPKLSQGSAKWPAHNGVHGGLFYDWWTKNLLVLEGEDHHRIRRLLNPAFSPRLIKDLVPRFQALANELIDAFNDKGECEFIRDFAEPYATRVLLEAGLQKKVTRFTHYDPGLFTQNMVTEVILDNAALSFREIIAIMERHKSQFVTYKIRPAGTNFIIGSNSSDDAKITGMTPDVLSLSGRCELSPWNILLPTWRFGYWISSRRWLFSRMAAISRLLRALADIRFRSARYSRRINARCSSVGAAANSARSVSRCSTAPATSRSTRA